MKKTFLIMGLLVLSASLYAQGLNFSKLDSWATVLKQAKAENKFIFLDGEATWCKPCKMMDEKVYASKKIGQLMNDKFISVKVQTDRADGDDAYLKSWYSDADMLSKKYQLSALPALVFLSPDGELLYRNFGFQDIYKFMGTVKFAISQDATTFEKELQAYRKGERDYTRLPKLIGRMRELLVEDSLANAMVRDYFNNYLKTLNTKKAILTKENAQLAKANPLLVKSTDIFFIELKNTPFDEADKLIEWTGGSRLLLETIATKEELYLKLFERGKIINQRPNWTKVKGSIKTKYPQLDAGKIIEDFGVDGYPFIKPGFYIRAKDFNRFNKYYQLEVDNRFKKEDLKYVNEICWWSYFVQITDKGSLELALRWASENIKRAKGDTKVSIFDLSGWMDTKAALLYKLGKRNEAIKVEQEALNILRVDNNKNKRKEDFGCDGFLNSIDKMKNGEKLDDGYGHSVTYATDWKLID